MKPAIATSPRLTIKNLKTGPSMEYGAGGSYTATVYFDGKRVMSTFEGGHGGPVMYPEVFDEAAKAEMLAFIEAEIQPLERYKDFKLDDVMDIFIGDTVNLVQEERDMKKACRTKVVAKLKSVDNGFVSYKCKFTRSAVEQIKKQCGDDLVEIVNYRYAQPK